MNDRDHTPLDAAYRSLVRHATIFPLGSGAHFLE